MKKIHFDSNDWRIGDLSVSKSFGDVDNTPYVDHIPESFIYPLLIEDEFIVIACDGVWDVLQNHEVVNFIRDHIHNNGIELYDIPHIYSSRDIVNQNIATKLGTYAIARGSADNVSIMIIIFNK